MQRGGRAGLGVAKKVSRHHIGVTLAIFLALLVLPFLDLPYQRLDWTVYSQAYAILDVQVEPQEPTTADSIRIILSGTWPNTCVPGFTGYRILGQTIYVEGEGGPGAGIFCAQALTPWSFAVDIGPLPAATYTVQARVASMDESIVAEKVVEFVVRPSGLPVPHGTATLAARVYVDLQCNGTLDGADFPLAGVPVGLLFSNGADQAAVTSAQGMVGFAGFDPAGGIAVRTILPNAYLEYPLELCPASRALISLQPEDFKPGRVPYKYLQFRVRIVEREVP